MTLPKSLCIDDLNRVETKGVHVGRTGGSHWQSSDTLISEASALLWLNFCLKPQEKNHACSENGTLSVFIAGTSVRFQETKGGRRLQSAHAAPRGSTRAAPIGQEVREAEILPLLASQSLRTQLCERGPSGFNLHHRAEAACYEQDQPGLNVPKVAATLMGFVVDFVEPGQLCGLESPSRKLLRLGSRVRAFWMFWGLGQG